MSSSLETPNYQKPGNIVGNLAEGGMVRATDESERLLLERKDLTAEELKSQVKALENFFRTLTIADMRWTPITLSRELRNDRVMRPFGNQLIATLGPKFKYLLENPQAGYPNLQTILRILDPRKKTPTLSIKK